MNNQTPKSGRPGRFSRRKRERRGFALVLALSLMAFVLVLLLSMTTLVRVESRAAGNQLAELHARQNARLGAMVALGELQKAAGPDRRATGTAALLDDNPESPEINGVAQPHWTGVWDPDEPETPVWLVSRSDPGTAPHPETAPANGIEIVGPASTDASVRVENRTIGEEGSDSFAWWVGDEGVKAKVNTTNPYLAPGATGEEQGLSLQTAQRAAAELLDIDDDGSRIGGAFNPADADLRERLRRLRILTELPLTDADLWTDPLLRRHFHNLTTTSAGLLADSAEGGLRRDLNLAFEMDLADFNADATFAAGGERPFPLENHDIRYMFNETNGRWVRGPTWHLPRNYYRLYKPTDPDRATKENHQGGVRDASGDPVVRARPPYMGDGYRRPRNWADAGRDTLTLNLGDRRNETTRPTAMAIAPVYIRRQLVFSLEAEEVGQNADGDTEYQLILHVDPVETLWNPYNVALEFSNLLSSWNWLNMTADITVDPPDDSRKTILTKFDELGGTRQDEGFMSLETRINGTGRPDGDESERTMRMAPGEIVVFSNTEGETERNDKGITRIYLGPGLGDGVANNIQNSSEGFSRTRLDSENTLERGNRIIVPEGTRIEIEIEGDNDRPMQNRMIFMDVAPQYSMFSQLFFEDSVERPDLSWTIQELNPVPGAPRKTPVGALQIQLKAEDAEDPIPLFAQANPFAGGISPFTDGKGYEEGPDAFEIGLRKITSWNNDLVSIDPPTNRGFWGPSHEDPDISRIPAVELPTAPLLSVASLQHAHVTMLPHQPAHAVANSYASPYIPRDQVRHALATDRGNRTQVDFPYLMNEALFDRYFFSSLAPRPNATGSPSLQDVLDNALADPEGRLPNTRMRLSAGEGETDAGLRDKLLKSDGSPTAEAYRRIAENLLIDGAFNVNSTSVEAWKAVLAGTNQTDVRYRGGTETDAESPLTRYRVPPGPPDEEWRGFNTLSPDQIAGSEEKKEVGLAEAIVREVKERFAQSGGEPAPFFGIADFVNRALADNETGLKGALQAAIDRTNINNGFSKGYQTENRTDLNETDFIHPEALRGPVAAGAPGYLSQRDLLVPLGPTLATRSDTFRIRARGARTNPATGAEETEAWVEMIVQRVPEKVDPAENIGDPDPPGGFGRRFEIVDFRWLSSADI